MTNHTPIPLFDNIESLQQEPQLPLCKISNESALNDYKQARNFLYTYRGSAETFKSYRRELERLLQWAWFVHGKSIKDLYRADLEVFLEFCQAPPHEMDWY